MSARVPYSEIKRLADLADQIGKAHAKAAVRMPAEERSAYFGTLKKQLYALAAHLSPSDHDRLEVEILSRTVRTLVGSMEEMRKRVLRRGVAFDPDAGDDGPTMRWGGFFDGEREYRAGEVVAYHDSLWVCERKQSGIRPAGPNSGFRLILKAPYDRRPAARARK
jgi:hypothetical protein